MPDIIEQTASDKLVHELTVATDASIGVIAIRCPETEVYRVVDDLYALALSQELAFHLHNSEQGWCSYLKVDPDDTRAEPFDPMKPKDADKTCADIGKAFDKLYNVPDSGFPVEGFFVMLDLYFSFDEMKTQTRLRKQASLALQNGQRLFVIVPHSATIPPALSPLMHMIEYDYPSRSELSDALDNILNALDDEDRIELEDDERQMIISNGQGMTTYMFENAASMSITEHTASHDDMSEFTAQDIIRSMREYKMQVLKKTEVLELQPNVPVEDIGGLDLFKAWMYERKLTFTDEAKENNVTPSRGALVVGPPGTGKSLVAKAAGSILNLPVIRLDIGRIFGQYIGQSETAMRGVLQLLDALAPCVLFLDEIDKGFSGMSGGSESNGGTTQRVFGTFLTWMQERDQMNRPVFLMMSANRVEGLPPELLRRGRVDETWAVNVPNDEEREAILKIHLDKRGQEMPKGDIKAGVRITDALVGAEIEALVEDALVMSLSGEEPGVNFDWLEQARANLKPMSDTRAAEFRAMAEWAERNARPASSTKSELSTAKKSDKTGTRIKRGGRVKAKPSRTK